MKIKSPKSEHECYLEKYFPLAVSGLKNWIAQEKNPEEKKRAQELLEQLHRKIKRWRRLRKKTYQSSALDTRRP